MMTIMKSLIKKSPLILTVTTVHYVLHSSYMTEITNAHPLPLSNVLVFIKCDGIWDMSNIAEHPTLILALEISLKFCLEANNIPCGNSFCKRQRLILA